MPDRIGDAAVGVVGTMLVALLAWARQRRRDEADTRTVLSADNREWAEMFSARLEKTEAKLTATEAELTAERKRSADLERRLAIAEADFERRMAIAEHEIRDLVREVRRLGGHVPGETPAEGTPAAAPEKGDDLR